ncbi:hypothetical protein HMPREF1584_00736 [Gardnerella vaginalis JCP8481A]|nr:hypothetical protein HMPREF1585_00979 [Gardnerella vaginalis JCP8481B]EPI42960.1 hypothetical protein HMPREF1584_00736 [Gardnerella vaginalis JCP8481A]
MIRAFARVRLFVFLLAFAREGSFFLLKFCESLLLSVQNRNYLYF